MPRWLRVARGMIGVGLIFAAGVGVVASAIAAVLWLVSGTASPRELIQLVAKTTIIAFPVGIAFAALVAISAGGRRFDRLSIPLFAALGAGGGLVLFLMLGVSGAFAHWSVADAIANLTILTAMGGASATATLMVARRGRPALKPGDESPRLGERQS